MWGGDGRGGEIGEDKEERAIENICVEKIDERLFIKEEGMRI